MESMSGDASTEMEALGGGRQSAIVDSGMNQLANVGASVDLGDVGNWASTSLDSVMGLGKIIFGFMQIVSTLSVTFPAVPWPISLTGVW